MGPIDHRLLPKQCILEWDWDKVNVEEEGLQQIELNSYIRNVMANDYWIVSIAVTEHDETGYPLHAVIIAIPPIDGKLH